MHACMREPNLVPTDGQAAEAIATASLFVLVTSVIAFVVCLGSWGHSDMLLAIVAGIVALVSFAVSIVCFLAQADERKQVSAG